MIHLLIIALVSLVAPGCPTHAATLITNVNHATFIVFADHHLPDAEWDDLLSALRRSLVSAGPSASLSGGSVDILRGDAIKPGLQLQDRIISIYLHGDCVLLPRPRTAVTGALGWVYRVHGQIPPFIHVDCEEITQILGPLALVMPTNRRREIMAEAMARIVLHEWVHIATQTAAHTRDGVAKSTFGIPDLLADDEEYRRHPARFTDRHWPLT